MGFDYIQISQRAESPALDFIVEAARSERATLYSTATLLLAKLTVQHGEARNAVLEMIADKKYQVRCNALLCLSSRSPHKFRLAVVQKGLDDKSARVRALASHQARHLNLPTLIPKLEYLAKNETNQNALKDIQLHLHLLRDGYAIMPFDESKSKDAMLWVPTRDGMRGRAVSRQEIKRRGISKLVRDLQKYPYS